MPYPSLLHPEPLSLWQSTADRYLHRSCSNTVLSQSLWGPWVLVHTRFVWALWREWGLILNAKSPLLPSCWGFSFALGHGVSPHSCSSATQPEPGGRNQLFPQEVLRLDLEVPLTCCCLVLKKYQIDKDTLFGYCLWLEAVFSYMWNLNWPLLLRLKTRTVS